MFARTARLLLRPGWMEDAPALAQAIGDEAVIRNLLRAPHPYGVDDARAFIGLPRDPLLPDFLIFSRTRGAPRLIGGCGLMRADDGGVELGYWIARPYWGLGFATEAAGALVGIGAAVGHRAIRATPFIDNPASANVLRKIGFHDTGRRVRRQSLARTEPGDCAVFEHSGLRTLASDPAADLYGDLYGDDAPPLAA